MNIKSEIKKNKILSESEKNLINNNRIKEFGKESIIDFKRDYEPNTEWFFVKENNKIVALGCLRPIIIDYLNKKHKIMGICSIISIEKGKGYGRKLIESMIDYLKKKGKTGLGFTNQTEFFKKAGLKTERDFIKRFVYKDSATKKETIDNEGDGIYYEGKEDFIKKVLSTQSMVFIEIIHW